MIEFRLLGVCEVCVDGQPLPPMRYRKDLWLLALLALRGGRDCPRDWLATTLWPDADESQALYYLRRSLSNVRHALGSEAQRLLSPTPRTVRLDLAGAFVDAAAFDHAARTGASDEQMAQAVALYRGPLLADCPDEWVISERVAREQAYLAALENLAQKSAAQSEPTAAVHHLRLLIAADPYRESAYCALMQALSERGDRAALRQAYQSLRVLLRRDLNTEPAPETQALYKRLSTQAARVIGLPAEPSKRNLPQAGPTQTDSGVRRKDVDAAADCLHRGRLATLLGPEGACKTRLAIAAAEAVLPQFDGGVWFVDLAPLTDPAQVADAVARALGAEAGSGAAARLAAAIGERASLLVLDHCDLVAAGCAALLAGLFASCPHLRALVVSARPLGMEDEQNCRMQPSGMPMEPGDIKREPAGGAVPLDSTFYVQRPTDSEFLSAVSRRDSIVLVKGAREMGKSSLLARGLQQARQQGARVALTDLQALGAAAMSGSENLLLTLADSLAEQLDLDADPRNSWSAGRAPTTNMERFLRREVLGTIAGPLVWGLDDLDRLSPPGCAFGNEIFGLFRSWHNRRSLDPEGPWSRLTLAMAYATEAHLFVTDLDQSPFNVGTRLTLSDFTEAQVADLNGRYGQPLKDAEETAAFQALLGGQPYLTRRGLDDMSRRHARWDEFAAAADRDDGPFGDHLRRLLIAVSQDAGLTDVVRELARGQSRMSAENFYRLRSAGVVSGASAAEVGFRCRLYQAYFTRLLL